MSAPGQTGELWLARRETRWDPYPRDGALVKVRVVRVGVGFVEMFHDNGVKTCEAYELVRRVPQ